MHGMPSKSLPAQIPFRYRSVDTITGVTRETAKKVAAHLGVDETQAIHMALQQLAARVLPHYEIDEGPLSASQLKQIKLASKKSMTAQASTPPKLRSSLFINESQT
jgi:antitoxin component of RelBE/YafQ-DinJ toxin-antitoxin module